MEEKILEKEYKIPFELFEKSFTQWQKKFVYPKTYIVSGLFLVLAVVYIISIIKVPSNKFAYILTALCLALAVINFYNPKKIKRNLLETVKTMEDETYKMTLYETFIEISTLIQSEEQEDDNEKEIFGDSPPETLESTKLYFNNGLKVMEHEEYFIIYQVKELYYVLPKYVFSEEELNTLRTKTS